MASVFLVTSGEYSSYSISAAFSSSELAQDYIDHDLETRRGGYEIEELDLDPLVYRVPDGYEFYDVTMDSAGHGNAKKSDGFYHTSVEMFPYFMGPVMYTTVMARTKEHAMKIANERRAFIVANNLWGKSGMDMDAGGILYPWQRGQWCGEDAAHAALDAATP